MVKRKNDLEKGQMTFSEIEKERKRLEEELKRRKLMKDLYKESELRKLLFIFLDGQMDALKFGQRIEQIYLEDKAKRIEYEKIIVQKICAPKYDSLEKEISKIDNIWGFFYNNICENIKKDTKDYWLKSFVEERHQEIIKSHIRKNMAQDGNSNINITITEKALKPGIINQLRGKVRKFKNKPDQKTLFDEYLRERGCSSPVKAED